MRLKTVLAALALAGLFASSCAKREEALPEAGPSAPAPAAAPGAAKLAQSEALSGAGPSGPSYEAFGQPFDEVWVIQKPEPGQVADAETPGSGELRAALPGKGGEVPLPLKHTSVTAAIEGYIASVEVRQQYANPYDEKIEAVYVFPLPENAAVSDFLMRVGKRTIRGIIREREEAERVYREARSQGYVASLLTQERPNVFTQRVANLEPGKSIDVDIRYFHTLAYANGEYSFVFPMVVGPRYNPAGFGGGIGAAPRGEPGASGQPVEVSYLRPGERSGHDVDLALTLDAGLPLEKVYSTTHRIAVERTDESRAAVRLAPADRYPNKDFVLRYRVAGAAVKGGLVAEKKGDGGYFTLMLQPPAELAGLPRTGQELVFVLDTSGSMDGWPIDKARRAIRHALANLTPEDTFQIVRFANGLETFRPAPVPASRDNVEEGLSFLEQLGAGGGTEMLQGVRGALDFPHDPKRLRVVCFFTDGFIGNEGEILSAVEEKLGPSRVFSFGVGSSVNRYLLEGLARAGRGAVAYVGTGDTDAEAVDRFFEAASHPALTDVSVDWGGLRVSEVYPRRLPDLFVGRPVILVGRFRGEGKATLRVSGRAGGERREFTVPVSVGSAAEGREGVSKVWARARIAALGDGVTTTGGAADEIRKTALEHGLLSAYTAFVAVDGSRKTEGDHGTSVSVAVPVPEGVRYETTVPGGRREKGPREGD